MTNAFLFVMPRNIRNIKDGKGNLAATLFIFELTPVLSIYWSDTFRSHSNHPIILPVILTDLPGFTPS